MIKYPFAILFCLCSLMSIGCTNIDCPLENVVMMHVGLYSSEDGKELTLSDTLTVRAAGTDTVLWNRGYDISSLSIPLRITETTDTFLFRLSNSKGQFATDTLFVEHINTPHFESVDCPASVFHKIKRIRWTTHHLSQMPLTIDSVAILRQLVDYETSQNIQIYLRSTAR